MDSVAGSVVVKDGVDVTEFETVEVRDKEGLELWVVDGLSEREFVSTPVVVADSDSDGVSVSVWVSEADSVLVTLPLLEREIDGVQLKVADSVSVPDAVMLEVDETERLKELLAVFDREIEAVLVNVPESVSVPVRVNVWDLEPLYVALIVGSFMETVRVKLIVRVALGRVMVEDLDTVGNVTVWETVEVDVALVDAALCALHNRKKSRTTFPRIALYFDVRITIKYRN
eukprot:Hpha_TRINITY_DN31449_c0_g1::TRINITY_DN31449_c0_g1_i1::g.145287::m.145287